MKGSVDSCKVAHGSPKGVFTGDGRACSVGLAGLPTDSS